MFLVGFHKRITLTAGTVLKTNPGHTEVEC